MNSHSVLKPSGYIEPPRTSGMKSVLWCLALFIFGSAIIVTCLLAWVHLNKIDLEHCVALPEQSEVRAVDTAPMHQTLHPGDSGTGRVTWTFDKPSQVHPIYQVIIVARGVELYRLSTDQLPIENGNGWFTFHDVNNNDAETKVYAEGIVITEL